MISWKVLFIVFWQARFLLDKPTVFVGHYICVFISLFNLSKENGKRQSVLFIINRTMLLPAFAIVDLIIRSRLCKTLFDHPFLFIYKSSCRFEMIASRARKVALLSCRDVAGCCLFFVLFF